MTIPMGRAMTAVEALSRLWTCSGSGRPAQSPVAALAAHAAHAPGRRFDRSNLRGSQRTLGPCDKVLLVAGPDAGAVGIIAPTDYPVQPGASSFVVLLDGRAVVVPTAWVGERL